MPADHILIAEDEGKIRRPLSIFLKKNGFEVSEAQNGREALDIINNNLMTSKTVNLLITDIRMPVLTGIELMERLRKKNIRLPVIGLTGFGDKDLVVNLLRLGCVEYIDKPFLFKTVLAAVKKVLESKEKENHLEYTKYRAFEEEKEKISHEILRYKKQLESYQKNFNSAVTTYRNLTDLSKINLPLAFEVRNKPLSGLGGDFIDISETESGVDILIADVAGHDMGASYHTVLLKAFFEENSKTGNDGQLFLKLLNRQLLDKGKNERMVTALHVRVDFENMCAKVVSAGHPPALILRKASDIPQFVDIDGVVLGMFESVKFGKCDIPLSPGDRVFLYTDGLFSISRFDENHRKIKLGLQGLAQVTFENRMHPFIEMMDSVWNHLLHFCSYKPNDDMLLVGFQI